MQQSALWCQAVGGLIHAVNAMVKEHDPSDTLAPSILKEKEDGVPDQIDGEPDKAFEGRVSDGPTTDMSKVGPPAAWVKEHGGKVNCPACGPKRGNESQC